MKEKIPKKHVRLTLEVKVTNELGQTLHDYQLTTYRRDVAELLEALALTLIKHKKEPEHV